METKTMTPRLAREELLHDRYGRGPGAGTILMADGREFHVEPHTGLCRLFLPNGKIEEEHVDDISGDCVGVSWTLDQTGNRYV